MRPHASAPERRDPFEHPETGHASTLAVVTDPTGTLVYTANLIGENISGFQFDPSGRTDANHRYTTDTAVRAEMVGKGWIAEGDGPNLVVMCAPAGGA